MNSTPSSCHPPKWLAGLISPFLLLLLSGCGGVSTLTKPEPIQVPEALLRPCRVPQLQIRTTEDLLLALVLYDQALALCSAEKNDIRTYLQGGR